MLVDNRKLFQNFGQIMTMFEDNMIVNECELPEEKIVNLFMFAYSDIVVNVIAQYKEGKYHIIRGKNLIETFRKYISNEIPIDNNFFVDLPPEKRRKLMSYQPNFNVILEEVKESEINDLVTELEKLN